MELKPECGCAAGRNYIRDKNPIIHQQFGHIFGDKEEDTEGLPEFQRNVIGNNYLESGGYKEGSTQDESKKTNKL
jgi:hypothetical protein